MEGSGHGGAGLPGPCTDRPRDSARLPPKAPAAWGPSQRLLGCALAGGQGPARTPRQTARAHDRVRLKRVSSDVSLPDAQIQGTLVHEGPSGAPTAPGLTPGVSLSF